MVTGRASCTVTVPMGSYVSTLSGEEGGPGGSTALTEYSSTAGGATPELWVADRGNARVQVYDLDGAG